MRSRSATSPRYPLVICEGNSLTEGVQVVPNTYPAQLQALLEASGARGYHTVFNDGHSGETVYNMIATYAPAWTAARVAGTSPVAILWEATNAIGLGQATDAGSLMTSTMQWGNMFRTIGVKVIMLPVIARALDPPNWTTDKQAMADAFNALLAVGWYAGADSFVDIRATFNDPMDPVKYDSGHLHLTAAGYGLVASAVMPEVRRLAGY